MSDITPQEAGLAFLIGACITLTVGALIEVGKAPPEHGGAMLFIACVCGGLAAFMLRGIFHV